MKKRLIEFTCPHCGSKFSMVRDTYLVYDAHSEQTRRLLDHTYFVHVCQNCFEPFFLVYPLMMRFLDNDQTGSGRKTLVLSDDKRRLDPLNGIEGQVVLCRTPSQFEEAFSILRLGLNPASVVPLLKLAAERKGGVWNVDGYDAEEGILWVKNETDHMGIIMKP